MEPHPDKQIDCRRWAWLVCLMIGLVAAGGLLAGWSLAKLRSDDREAQVVASTQSEIQRMQDINHQLMLIIEQRLPPLVAKTDAAVQAAQEAVSKAEGASKTAAGAGATARQAATTAKSAANKASEAVADVKEAVTPQPVEPKDPPDWLGGS